VSGQPKTWPQINSTSKSGGVTLLHTPLTVAGKRIKHCLVDTGAQVNLLPVAECVRHGIKYEPYTDTTLYGFNGAPGEVVGRTTLTTHVGPSTNCDIEFLITPEVTTPLLGLPGLKLCGLIVDCVRGELRSEATGDCVRCTLITNQKN
ncbi:retroviral-like aspartic protease family protein, partial [Pyruvatibacter sp.]